MLMLLAGSPFSPPLPVACEGGQILVLVLKPSGPHNRYPLKNMPLAPLVAENLFSRRVQRKSAPTMYLSRLPTAVLCLRVGGVEMQGSGADSLLQLSWLYLFVYRERHTHPHTHTQWFNYTPTSMILFCGIWRGVVARQGVNFVVGISPIFHIP